MSYRTNGLTLIEVMFALFFALFLISSLTHLYLQHHRRFLQQQVYLQLSEAGNKVVSLLRDEISMAGNIGCARLSRDFIVQPYHEYTLTEENKLEVNEQRLKVRYQAYPSVTLLRDTENKRTLNVERGVTITPQHYFIISDCIHAEIFAVKAVSIDSRGQHVSAVEPLKYSYQTGAEIGELVIRQYMADDQLVRIESDGRSYVIQANIHQLHFKRKNNEIYYSFQTSFNQVMEDWYGYAFTA